MSFIKRSQLREYARVGVQSLSSLQEAQSRRELHAKRAGKISSIFLSHSHQDRDLVLPAVSLLKSLGTEVYVDWMDGEMPPRVSGETAKRLKGKIAEHDKFIVLVTENSKDSHWVPWELGIADGVRGIPRIASFPVEENDKTFLGNEYFSIYPRIELYKGDWIVWTADPASLRYLKEWIAAS